VNWISDLAQKKTIDLSTKSRRSFNFEGD
jgi:hypothetical protein